MRSNSRIRNWLVVVACGSLLLAVTTAAATTPAKKPKTSTAKSSTTTGKHSTKKKKARTSKKRGQNAIDTERTQQIQEALIREHYLQGEASGKWDDATQAALRRYQADHGWQNKTVPDSRALIKLGLGPNHDHLLNPETAMTAAPASDPKPAAKPAVTPPAQAAPTSNATPQR